jgi:hypothetical protein
VNLYYEVTMAITDLVAFAGVGCKWTLCYEVTMAITDLVVFAGVGCKWTCAMK